MSTKAIEWIIGMQGHDGIPGCPKHCHVCGAKEELKALLDRLDQWEKAAQSQAKQADELEQKLFAAEKGWALCEKSWGDEVRGMEVEQKALESRLEELDAEALEAHRDAAKAEDEAQALQFRLGDALNAIRLARGELEYDNTNFKNGTPYHYCNECAAVTGEAHEAQCWRGLLWSVLVERHAPIVDAGSDTSRVVSHETTKRDTQPQTLAELEQYNRDSLVCDGFGAQWLKCDRADCALAVVRPGRARCEHEICPTSYKSE